ncbi:MAG: cyclic nucleotide-binding domain-containing protein [Magnetococcales bacterium]|nr:cyclic nucleotide-binding domain-containing protein [Magnetococcales bacterium]
MDVNEFGFNTRFLRVYDAAQEIFRQGAPGDTMFVISEGQVDITIEANGGTVVVAHLGKGEFFGEMALVDNSPRSAGAVAGPQGARVLAIDAPHFIYLVSQQPAFALVVLGVMANRLRKKNEG